MPSILSRIFVVYHLLHTILSCSIPKKLRSILLLPSSWFPHLHQPNNLPVLPKNEEERVTGPSSSPPLVVSLKKRMDQAEMKKVFQMFDRNGDGRITKEELSGSLQSLGIFISDKDLIQMIEKIDVNRDGCVDIDEFGDLYSSLMEDKDEEEDMREVFSVFDQNGDGFISVEELRSVLTSLGLKQGRTVEDCKKMITKVDVDGDGMVDYKEFKRMMKGGGLSALSC